MNPAWHAFFDGKVLGDGWCLLWGKYKDALGYGRGSLRGLREVKTHRMSWTLANGKIPRGKCVLHRCDVRHCVNPAHLWLGTQQENIADMNAKGRARRAPPRFGTANQRAVLDEEEVWAIRHVMIKFKRFPQAEIARSYKVSPMTISRIANNQTWPHIVLNWPFGDPLWMQQSK